MLLVREPQAYKAALSADPEYLVNHLQQQHEVEDFRNWTIQLGRGFRGLKLWFVLRAYGLAKLQDMIRNHLAMTKSLYQRMETHSKNAAGQRAEDSLFVTLCEPRLNTICLRMRSEELTHRLLQILTSRGQIYLTPTRIRGTFWLRIAIGQTAVLQTDIDFLWSQLQLCGLEAIRAATSPLAP